MRKLMFVMMCLMFFSSAFAQEKIEISGVVTYLTTQNVYVKFLSAKKISQGDQLFQRIDGVLQPVMTVEQRSSVSVVGKTIGEVKFEVGDQLIALIDEDQKVVEGIINESEKPVTDQHINQPIEKEAKTSERKQDIKGRILLTSYSNISNLDSTATHRLRYTFSFNAANITNSRFSFESYISFAHKLNDWAAIQENIYNGLKIYSLNLKYDVGKSTSIWLGRKINPKISSLGAIDGLQFETTMKQFYFGAVTGFRPDYTDYSLNRNLLEYGAFVGHKYQSKKGNAQTSLALFQQNNNGKVDRRFLYFQHDNTLLPKLGIFYSTELDLYRLQDGQPVSDIILTSMYFSVRYRPFKTLSITGSYDNRRNVIYYETFKNYIDKLLEDATRQGVQLRLNYRPLKFMTTGLSGSYRMRDNDLHPTQNANAFVTFNQVPWIDASLTLSANVLQNSYISGQVYGCRLNRDFLSGKMNTGLNYRYVNYVYLNVAGTLKQHIAEADVTYRLNRNFSVSFNYELTLEDQINYHRVYFSLMKRF
ncbi:MAG: hypothetical protein JXR22_04805 [Prolixibacteraceae bacterium]|nr:hypothetical protein [Prolixibacteraceae bacterium]